MNKKMESHNSSISSSSSNDSNTFDGRQSCSKSTLPRASSQLKLERKREKRWRKNKIAKEDFFNKTGEFRTWLKETKNVQFDTLSTPKAKSIFKKFISKWNGKKLDKKYYSGVGLYWTAASPSAYSHHTSMPILNDDNYNHLGDTEDDAKFSTFGKRAGHRVLREMQQIGEDQVSKRFTNKDEHVYDVPLGNVRDECFASIRTRHGPVKVRPPLTQMIMVPSMQHAVEDEELMLSKVAQHRPLSMSAVTVGAQMQLNEAVDPAESYRRRLPHKNLPRPHTEYVRMPPSYIYGSLRRQHRSTSSTGSTESASSCASSMYSSTSGSSSRSSLAPKPPPRTSSCSREMREVAKVVLEKMGVTPTKNKVNMMMPKDEPLKEVCDMVSEQPLSPPLPPPPPIETSEILDDSLELPPPPAACTLVLSPNGESPCLPSPPSPLVEVHKKDTPTRRRESMLLARTINHHGLYSPRTNTKPSLTPPPAPVAASMVKMGLAAIRNGVKKSGMNQLRVPNGLPSLHENITSQDTITFQKTPQVIPLTRRRIMTPHQKLVAGQVYVPDDVAVSPNSPRKSPKRQSDSPLKSNLAITPAKKISLDISYQSTCV